MADDSRNRSFVLGATAVALLLALLAWKWEASPGDVEEAPAAKPAATVTSGDESGDESGDPSRATSVRRSEHKLGVDPAVKDAEAAEYLREQFGATITNKHTQIKTLEKLIGYLMKTYPEDWQQRVQALLAQAFPGLAGQLYAQYQNMTAYNDWLKANRDQLSAMSPPEKRDAMNDARFRYFGSDAAEIWEESLRHERIYDAMDSISQATDTSVDQKLKTYLDAINETYGEQAPEFLDRRQTELMTNFLVLPSVQNDLHSMTPEGREQQLQQIRRALGMDDAALERWRDLDGQRDQAWQNGERYMSERDGITKAYQGDEQVRRLQDLRSRTFGEDADTVSEEEDSGFFRYGHPRVYGKE